FSQSRRVEGLTPRIREVSPTVRSPTREDRTRRGSRKRRLAGTTANHNTGLSKDQNTTMGTIQIRTEIPGPRSKALMRRRQATLPRALSHATPIFAASAAGAHVTDVDDNVYLDLAGGIGVMNVGHSQPAVVDAVKKQVDQFTHTCFSVAPYESYVALAERLAAITPGKFAKKTLLVNSGAEAVENAIKIARHATGRPGGMGFGGGFHGRTLFALSLTSKATPCKAGFGPVA